MDWLGGLEEVVEVGNVPQASEVGVSSGCPRGKAP